MLTTLIVLAFSGALVGILSILFGTGGGVIAVPFLYFAYPSMSPPEVIGTSLAMIFFVSLNNSLAYRLRGERIETRLLLPFIFFVPLGVGAGVYLAHRLPPNLVKGFFAVFLVLVAIRVVLETLFFPRSSSVPEIAGNSLPLWKSGFTGISAGFLSAMTGTGGGSVLSPLFLSLYRMPIRRVGLYSNWVMTFISLLGTMSYILVPSLMTGEAPLVAKIAEPFFFRLGQVDVMAALMIFLGAALTTRLGFWLRRRLSARALRLAFSGLLFIVAARMIW